MDSSDVLKKRLEWMECTDRTDELYINGVNEFLDFAFANISLSDDDMDDEVGNRVPCPCNACNNKRHKKRQDIYDDLLLNGIVRGYVRWLYHGESKPPLKRCRAELEDTHNEDLFDMICESRECGTSSDAIVNDYEFIGSDTPRNRSPMNNRHAKDRENVDKLMRDAQISLYPGCEEFSKLSFILKLFQIKCMDGMTNKAFSSMLKMFKNALPHGADIPSSYYEARKMITDLGFDYVKIEACENDCMLFWKDDANLDKCNICERQRDKTSPKVLRYFPITPRLQRLFRSSKTSNDMRWHFEKRKTDGVLRHPAGSEAWKHFDSLNSSFASDPRNVRLGLASDGFNPFGGLRSDYSIWPVVLLVYNLPPWMCMKQPFSILSLIIPEKVRLATILMST